VCSGSQSIPSISHIPLSPSLPVQSILTKKGVEKSFVYFFLGTFLTSSTVRPAINQDNEIGRYYICRVRRTRRKALLELLRLFGIVYRKSVKVAGAANLELGALLATSTRRNLLYPRSLCNELVLGCEG
jgi:hypothetical protein